MTKVSWKKRRLLLLQMSSMIRSLDFLFLQKQHLSKLYKALILIFFSHQSFIFQTIANKEFELGFMANLKWSQFVQNTQEFDFFKVTK